MKFVRQTITIPEDLSDYVEEQSRKGGEPSNVSKFIRELIRRDKEEQEAGRKKKAA